MASITDQIKNFFSDEEQTSLRGLFIEELQDIYWAENHLVDNLPVMAKAATSSQLRQGFEMHLQETRNQVVRLEQVFRSIGEEPESKKCEAMNGLVKEAQEIISDTTEGTMVRDAGLIIAGQKVEHYEIASYGSLRTIAQILGYNEAAQLLEKTLEEEKKTDAKLTEIAESYVNMKAKQENTSNASQGTASR
ncbi:MAG: ferritin-like domain-containing protein [Cytophagaceae bacterium]|nr:ferritin-like domain-containing protein [Cytophagaceae bacterium]